MSFSTRRIAAGFTLEDVSTEFGVTPAAVREWEEGKAQPPLHITRSLDLISSFAAEPGADAKGGSPAVLTKAVPSAQASPTPPRSNRQVPMAKALNESPESLIRTKKRVADHGEVFTPSWLVEKMLDLVKGETERIESRFLEPACGSGNFLVPILQRKLAAVEVKYGRSEFERRQYALYALSCLYGIELLADNIAECRANMLEVFASYLGLDPSDDLYRAASHVLSVNLIHGDAMTMKAADGNPITVAEWSYLGKGKFNRRDFRLDVLTGMSKFSEERSLFAHLGKHEIFQAVGSYAPMTVPELAAKDVSA
jgi:transcriptional regulator with XRE-family HTH domain